VPSRWPERRQRRQRTGSLHLATKWSEERHRWQRRERWRRGGGVSTGRGGGGLQGEAAT
jgi:hypothetical protein